MSDPYKEASPRSPGHGLHPLAWLAIAGGVVVALGLVMVVGVGWAIASRVSDVAEDFREDPVTTSAELVTRFDPGVEVVRADEDAGTLTLRDTRSDQTVTLDFQALARDLDIDIGDFPEVEFEGKVGDRGGFMTITTDEGEMFFGIEGDEDGGQLVIRTPDGDARFRAGKGAVEVPSWVPWHPEASRGKGVFHAETEDQDHGMVATDIDEDFEDVVEWYVERLERDGFDVEVEGRIAGSRGRYAAVHARGGENEREVTVIVTRKRGHTKTLVRFSTDR